MTVDIAAESVPEGLGFQGYVDLPATRYRQGGITMYDVILSIGSLIRAVQMPDPAKKLDDNRVVSEPRARKFGVEYVMESNNEFGWVCPALTVRIDPGVAEIANVVAEFDDGSAWVVLRLPAALAWRILDGQHRALGFEMGLKHARDEIAKQREHVRMAKQNGLPKTHITDARDALTVLEDQLTDVESSHASITMMIASSKVGRQAFVDIARNAKGVNPDFTVVLDQRSPVHRIAIDISQEHPLLDGRVESGQRARMGRTSSKLVGAKTVADIVHASIVGGGRVSRRRHDEISREETKYKGKVSDFLDSLVASFTTFQAVVDGSMSPQQVRETSLLGSSTMLRVLAIVWHDLREEGISTGNIEEFFSRLESYMVLPSDGIDEKDLVWMPTGAFLPGASAPQARQGSISGLANSLKDWYRNGIPTAKP